MARTLERLLSSRGFRTVIECRAISRNVDIVAASPDLSRIMSFEVKLNDWRHALTQALSTQVFADVAWVALPQGSKGLLMAEEFEDLGVGLISVNGGMEVVAWPRVCKPADEVLRRRIIGQIRSAGG